MKVRYRARSFREVSLNELARSRRELERTDGHQNALELSGSAGGRTTVLGLLLSLFRRKG